MSGFTKLVGFILMLGTFGCVYFIGTTALTNKESAMLGVILTMFSVLASWIFTHAYSENQQQKAIDEVKQYYQENLRTYARKAAEKVNNLSKELTRLSVYLQEELENNSYDQVKDSLIIKAERMRSAIHIVNTLKLVNDTALSDWEGVIGDLLERQREKREEREEELRLFIERLGSLADTEVISEEYEEIEDKSQKELKMEIENLRKELRIMASSLGMTTLNIPQTTVRYVRPESIEKPCPQCGEILHYKQKRREGLPKAVRCKVCETKLISRYTETEGFTLEKRQLKAEAFDCTECGAKLEAFVDAFVSSNSRAKCDECGVELLISRGTDGLYVKPYVKKQSPPKHQDINEAIISKVREKLPPQPWPVGVHRSVAEELEIRPSLVFSAISQLISRGEFHPQISGEVVPKGSESVDQ